MAVDNRLLRIAGMIKQGSTVADIGTDHAHLPVFLINEGKCEKVFACDVADGPLKNARENIINAAVTGIEIRKGNGLNAVMPYEAETFVIAGMGGDLIAKIISDAPWIKQEKYELILQPMTSVEDLRRYLCDEGFKITEEKVVNSIGRVYIIMKAVYCGKPLPCNDLFYYIGLLDKNMGDDEVKYIRRKLRIITKICKDISNLETEKSRCERLYKVVEQIKHILGEKDEH